MVATAAPGNRRVTT